MKRTISRRDFHAAVGASALLSTTAVAGGESLFSQAAPLPQAFSIIPVVGDGKWIWNKPPEETGYLEAREFDVRIGVELQGKGNAARLQATSPVPVGFPEQRIERVSIDTEGCQATIRKLGPNAAQLALFAPSIVKGQRIAAIANFRVTLFKQYHAFDEASFANVQQPPRDIQMQYMGESPGIQTNAKKVRQLAKELRKGKQHPWQIAFACYEWVWNNIRARIGTFTSVEAALRDRVGDCEERAATFVALCRSAGIPARLVWVPNHNWAEFYLVDNQGDGHWIPAHTAAYSWFGWTGAHELVLQKGDRIKVPEERKYQRLVNDWMQWQGARPTVNYGGQLAPVPIEDQDPGPGARQKQADGRWKLLAKHPLDRKLRDGKESARVDLRQ